MITYLKQIIPNDVRARVVDYVMVASLFAGFTVVCLILVGIKLRNELAEIGNILP